MTNIKHHAGRGWRCILLDPWHSGPCAAVPRWWNIVGRIREYRATR